MSGTGVSRGIAALLGACLIAAALSACGPSAGPVRLGPADSGKPVALEVGQQMQVALPGNPSTGYNWVVVSVDQSVLEPAEKGSTFKQGGAPGVVGAGGVVTWTFTANSAGTTNLVLGYKRPWETTATPTQTWSAPVTVK